MNKFIVWDKNRKRWLNVFGLTAMGKVFNPMDTTMMKNTEVFNYIGKTDIDGNKIYADSSIVEFEYYSLAKKWEKEIGYFKYISDSYCYAMIVLNSVVATVPISKVVSKNIKIIGTLQENRELLK